MKKTWPILVALLATHAAIAADGLITFQYFALNPGDTPIELIGTEARTPFATDLYTVGLFAGNKEGNNAAIPLATVRVFGTTGLFQYEGGDVAIPGSTPGQGAQLTLKVWDGSSFSSADTKSRGELSFFSAPLGGPNPVPPPPAFTAPDLSSPSPNIGFHGMVVVVGIFPEPSTYALATLGVAALALARQRNQSRGHLKQ